LNKYVCTKKQFTEHMSDAHTYKNKNMLQKPAKRIQHNRIITKPEHNKATTHR